MRVAIHQPNFAPWLGYFAKMADADLFVFLDDAQYSKNSYTNRVKIRGDRWLTIPVKVSLGTLIMNCPVANPNFRVRLAGQLQGAYGKSPEVQGLLAALEAVESEHLVDFNYASIAFLAEALGVKTPVLRSSELGVEGTSTTRLINIVRAAGGDEYLSGAGGANYQDEVAFKEAGIALTYAAFDHPVYPQPGEVFVRGYSALDALVGTRGEAASLLTQLKASE